MPLFAILHCDHEGLHSSSCTIVAANSEVAIAKNILENPERWRELLFFAQPDDGDPCSIWRRIQTGRLAPDELLTLINKTSLDADFGDMVRIYPVEIQALDDVNFMRLDSDRRKIDSTQDAVADSGDNPHVSLLPQLAEDARSLLRTRDFQSYVETLLKQSIWQVSNLRNIRLIPDILTWLIPSLQIPIKLSDIQIGEDRGKGESEECCRYFYGNIQLGMWSSSLEVPIHPEELSDLEDARIDTLEDRWLDVGDSLRKSIEVHGFLVAPQLTPEQQSKLLLELTCLIAYATELLIPRRTTSSKVPSTQ